MVYCWSWCGERCNSLEDVVGQPVLAPSHQNAGSAVSRGAGELPAISGYQGRHRGRRGLWRRPAQMAVAQVVGKFFPYTWALVVEECEPRPGDRVGRPIL